MNPYLPCIHCKKLGVEHVQNRCLFAPTYYRPMTKKTFIIELARETRKTYQGRPGGQGLLVQRALQAVCPHDITDNVDVDFEQCAVCGDYIEVGCDDEAV